jgi:polysaccharide pyruvyl transferase WcaK-like protein
MIIGSLGTATAQNKLAVGYGSEAGHMDPSVAKMCGRYCKDALVITRNEESRTILRKLGVPTELGTDTAWTFEPLPPEYGRKALLDAGWDGKMPVLIVCPINPFWWPVKPSLVKYAARAIGGAYKDSHYRTVYFHKDGADVENAFERYLTAIAKAVDAFRQRHRVFIALCATEQLDTRACRRVSEKLGGTAVFSSENYDMFQMVSILRAGHLMASSRFHGIVTSMPALVPSAGITMDERIRNLMRERGHDHLFLTVDDPDLEPKLLQIMERLVAEADATRDGIGRTVVRNLKMMARMGTILEDAIRHTYPEFPLRSGVLSWEDYLPPLNGTLLQLVDRYDTSEVAQHSVAGSAAR